MEKNQDIQVKLLRFSTAWELYEDELMLQRLEERENLRFRRSFE